ncbi:MAG TPA: HAD family hydrolase [Burkholderiales bacterium]|nr:HAD family hydrolase [Burkholderiales bacterium]
MTASASELDQRARGVRLLVLDVDGVLTDGRLYYGGDEVELKAFHIQDGHGLKMLRESGIEVAIITGRTSQAVERRAQNLGVQYVYQGVADKLAVFEQLLAHLGLSAAATAGMGDDLPDLPILRRCGLAVTVPEAPALIRSHAHYVTSLHGGSGAVREVCELLMQAQGTLEGKMQEYLR